MMFDELSLKSVAVTGKRYVISDETRPGFAIKVNVAGSAAYYYRYRKGPKKKEVELGEDFQQALALYNALRASAGKKGLARLAQPEVVTDNLFHPGINLPLLMRAYHVEHVVSHMAFSTQRDYGSYLVELKTWAQSQAPSLYHGQCGLMQARDSIKSYLLSKMKSAPVLCNRQRACYSAMFKWGSRQRSLVRDNPMFNMPSSVEKPKHRRLRPDELEVFLPVLQGGEFLDRHKDALKLILLTCLRPGEVLRTRGKDVRPSMSKPGEYNLHIVDTKPGVEQIVPLSRIALAILSKYKTTIGTERLFPSSLFGLRQVCMKACKRADVTVCSSHDLRRTAATICASLGVPKEIIPLLLNHSPSGVTDRHYAIYNYLPERRTALEKLATAMESFGLAVGNDVTSDTQGTTHSITPFNHMELR